MQFRTKFW